MLGSISASLERNLPAAKESKGDGSDPRLTISSLLSALERINSLGHCESSEVKLTLPVDAAGWKVACQELVTRQPEGLFWDRIRPNVEFSEVDSALQTSITAGQFDQQDMVMIHVTHRSPINSSWNEVVHAIQQRLDASATIAPTESHLLIAALCEMQQLGISEASAVLKALSIGGHLLHHFHRATAKKQHHDCKALCAYLFLRECPDRTKPPTIGSSDDGHANLTSAFVTDDSELASRLVHQGKRTLIVE